ncbi:MAG: hypothetical protein QOD74_1684 [Variibacter sp.]|jgi:protein gp37|nr:hypothetical protein [Variibacter sp.]
MADKSKIEWTDATWNPVTGCSVVSPGCTNCYAMQLAGTRLARHPSRVGLTDMSKAGPVWNGHVRLNEQWLTQPLEWKRARMIFVCAHGDLFHESVPDEWIDRVFAVMALAPQHTFQVLTKRAERMRAYLRKAGVERRVYELACDLAIEEDADVVLIAPGVDPNLAPPGPRVFLDQWPLPNVWLGVSTERQKEAFARIPHLLQTPAAVRFVSAEPLLGPIDLRKAWQVNASGALERAFPSLDWVIAGGESGKRARPMHPDWARSLREQCEAADVEFFFKQWGEWVPLHALSFGDGREIVIGADGHHVTAPDRQDHTCARMFCVGKKAAGRLLDGRTHDGMPGRCA